ncbi:hypothetical protein FKM82_012268 [Ascaphus truei]
MLLQVLKALAEETSEKCNREKSMHATKVYLNSSHITRLLCYNSVIDVGRMTTHFLYIIPVLLPQAVSTLRVSSVSRIFVFWF